MTNNPVRVTLATLLDEPIVTSNPALGRYWEELAKEFGTVTHVRPGIAVELPEVTRQCNALVVEGVIHALDDVDDLDYLIRRGIAALAVKLHRQQEAAATTRRRGRR